MLFVALVALGGILQGDSLCTGSCPLSGSASVASYHNSRTQSVFQHKQTRQAADDSEDYNFTFPNIFNVFKSLF
ncbi:MAG: hypothetical protein Kow0075_16050 [Salibacteraceae bacterium]